MENKDPIKATSTIITFIICLAGAGLCYWLYTQIIQTPTITDATTTATLEVNKKKFEKVKEISQPTITVPETGYGRANPLAPYK